MTSPMHSPLQSPLQPVMRSPLEFMRRGGGAFDPASMFTPTTPGWVYDLSDFSTLFQDSAGTIPVTAVEQPVGLVLDKSQGLELGPELASNPGNPFTTTADWTIRTGMVAVVEGGYTKFSLTSIPDLYRAAQPISCVVGRTYKVSMTLSRDVGTAGNIFMMVGVNSALTGGAAFSGIYPSTFGQDMTITGVFVATQTTHFIGFNQTVSTVGTDVVRVKSVTSKLLPGNHDTQPTATKRAVLSARVNRLLATDVLSTQSVAVTAVPYVLSFTGTGTITLTGASTAGPLVGTGASNRVDMTFTPTAGSLTLTVSGSVTLAQLEYAV